jgi:hypothetical protein
LSEKEHIEGIVVVKKSEACPFQLYPRGIICKISGIDACNPLKCPLRKGSVIVKGEFEDNDENLRLSK